MAWGIDLLAATRNGPTAIDGLHPGHDPSQIFGDGEITAHQFLEASQAVFTEIDGAEMVQTQQLGQAARVDLFILFAFSHGGILSRITHHQFRDVGLQQVVQPGGRGSFFKRDPQVSVQPIDKLQNHAGLRLDDTFHHDLSCTIPHRNRNAFLVHIHADIFGASHKRVLLSEGVEPSTQNLLQKGRPLYCVAFSDIYPPRTPPVEERPVPLSGPGSIPITSLTASRNRCLHPRYFSVVCTETCPSKNWICSSSPPAL